MSVIRSSGITGVTSLVTGGCGFIGSHLVDYLLEKGHTVYVLDNLVSGDSKNLNNHKNLYIFKVDVIDKPTVLKTVITDRLDYVFHLASIPSPDMYFSMPIETIKTNTLGTLNILELALKYKSTVIFTSTSEVYGDPQVHPQDELYTGNVDTMSLRAVYDESKRLAETMCYVYINKFNLDVKIARIFNTYGPRMKPGDGRVIPNFINQALSNLRLNIYGDGNQTRCFCYVSDTVRAIYKLSLTNRSFSGPVNIGSTYEISVNRLSRILSEIIKEIKPNYNYEVIYKPLRGQNDPRMRRPDVSKAKTELFWEPKVSLEDGLRKTIIYASRQPRSEGNTAQSGTF